MNPSMHQMLVKTCEDIDLAERAVAVTWAADDHTAIAHLSTTCEMLVLALKNMTAAVERLVEEN